MTGALLLTILALCAIFFTRNEIVFRARMRRISEISAKNHGEFARADFIEVMERRYAELESPGYDAMLFDLRRWTYRQFYPQEVA